MNDKAAERDHERRREAAAQRSAVRWLVRLSRWGLVSRRRAAAMLIPAIKAEGRTMVTERRLWSLFDACSDPRLPAGSLVECGVARGGCVALMALVARGTRAVWGFDSFEAMPPLSEYDEGDGQGWVGFRCSGEEGLDGARDTLERFCLDGSKVNLVKGWFEDSLPRHVHDLAPIAVLRLDNDWYRSTRYCLETLYELVAPMGFVLVDDYHTFLGCRKAVDEFRARKGVTSPLVTVEAGSEAYWRKE